MLLEPIDGYCERLGPGLWQEPLNVGVSALLVCGALWLALRLRHNPPYRRLALMLVLVGLAATAEHLFGRVLPLVLVLAAIAGFVLAMIYRVSTDLIGLRPALARVVTVIFLPFTLGTVPLLSLVSGPLAGLALVPFPILCLGTAAALRGQDPALARDYVLAAAGLGAAIVARMLDAPLCGQWPWGTQFLYILLTGAVLLRLVAVTARHALAGKGAGR